LPSVSTTILAESDEEEEEEGEEEEEEEEEEDEEEEADDDDEEEEDEDEEADPEELGDDPAPAGSSPSRVPSSTGGRSAWSSEASTLYPTTGSPPLLTGDDHDTLIDVGVSTSVDTPRGADGRSPSAVGTSAASTRTSIETAPSRCSGTGMAGTGFSKKKKKNTQRRKKKKRKIKTKF
jgi:hypothetical protein